MIWAEPRRLFFFLPAVKTTHALCLQRFWDRAKMESHHLSLSEGSTPLWWLAGIIDEWMKFGEGEGGVGGAVKRHFTLLPSLLEILPAQRSQPVMRVPVWSHKLAWISLAPLWSLSSYWTGRSYMGWTLKQLGPGITRGKECDEEWERKEKAAAAVPRVWGSCGGPCPCFPLAWDGGQPGGTPGEGDGRDLRMFPKALDNLPRPRSLKWT